MGTSRYQLGHFLCSLNLKRYDTIINFSSLNIGIGIVSSTSAIHAARALTNTVGGKYECIHDYRVTNMNASIRRMPADSPLFGKKCLNDLKTRAPFYLIRTRKVPKLNRYQPV